MLGNREFKNVPKGAQVGYVAWAQGKKRHILKKIPTKDQIRNVGHSKGK